MERYIMIKQNEKKIKSKKAFCLSILPALTLRNEKNVYNVKNGQKQYNNTSKKKNRTTCNY